MKQTLYFFILIAFLSMSSMSSQVTLVGDINTGAGNSNPYGLTVFNGKLYFQAKQHRGFELYSYDGVNAPLMVKDIWSGSNSFDQQNSSLPTGFTVFNNKLYFRAENGTYGSEMFSCDVNDTIETVDIISGYTGSIPMNFTVFNNQLFFTGYNASLQSELYRYSGSGRPVSLEPAGNETERTIIGVYKNKLYFTKLTISGQLTFNSIDTNNNIQSRTGIGVTKGTVFRNKLYMATQAGVVSYDGTTVQSITAFSGYVIVGGMINFNDNLFFKAISSTSNSYGKELYKYDGTTVSLVKDIRVGSSGSNPKHLTPYNGKLYFSATEATHGEELWSYDPTNDSVALVADIFNGAGGSFIADMAVFRDQLYISAKGSGTTGAELYSYGTRRTTSVLKRIPLNKLIVRQNGEKIFVSNSNGADLKGDYKVYDVQGRLIEMGVLGRKELTIDKTSLQSGLYMVSIQNQTVKFVVE